MANSENSSELQKNKNFIELIAFDKNEAIQEMGKCKIMINRLSRILFIEPYNEDHKLISASYEWKYVCKKNILFVLVEHSFQDFALAFNNEERCKKVYNILCKDKKSIVPEDSLIYERIIFPMFRAASMNNSNLKLRDLLIQWINFHTGNAKKELIKMLKDINVSDNIFGNYSHNFRKRKYSKFQSSNDNDLNNYSSSCGNERVSPKRPKHSFEKNYTKCLTEYMDVFISSKRRLAVFTSDEKIDYYEYSWNSEKHVFLCVGCRIKYRQIAAIMEKDEEGNECLKLEDAEHCCSPKKYNAAKTSEIKKLKKPNYEIFENGQQKHLIVFYHPDKSQCYEYGYRKHHGIFQCKGCNLMHKRLSAKLCYTADGEEYVEIFNDKHKCEPRKYEPKKYSNIFEYSLKPNFETRKIIENGVEKKILIVLNGNNKNLCYIYLYSIKNKRFICRRCISQYRKFVTAKLHKNNDGEEYVILSMTKHLCALQQYIPVMENKDTIIELPNFEYMEKTSSGVPKLFIFDANDRTKCYTFSKIAGTNRSNRYYCVGCHNIANEKNVKLLNGREIKGIVYVQLCQNAEGKHFIQLEARQNHLCKLQKYKPEYYQIKQNITSFLLYKTSSRPLSAAIFDPNDDKLCYTFWYSPSLKYFDCFGCQKKKKHALARLFKDDNENEYFVHDFKKHVCKPTKVSTLKQSGIKILEKSGLTFEGFSKKKKIEESKIVRKPNYEFREHKNGISAGILIILHPENQDLCYEYYKSKQYFMCRQCKSASAKLICNEDEKYIVLGKKEHHCEPIKYQKPDMIIIKPPNYQIFKRDFDNKPNALIIFTTPNQEFCYEMNYFKKLKLFCCSACKTLKQTTSAAFRQSNGEECIQLLKNHICQPLKFDRKNYQPREILESGFELQITENAPDSKLVIFSNAKKDMGYEYYLLKDQIYKCIRCEEKKRPTTAELFCDENGKTYVKLGNNRHRCVPKKVTQKCQNQVSKCSLTASIREGDIAENISAQSNIKISDDSDNCTKKSYNFKLHEYQRNGKLCQKLFVFDEDNDEMCQIYVRYDGAEDGNSADFECYHCRKNFKNKISFVQLKTDKYGKEYIDLTKDIHTCAPHKFDPNKFEEYQKLYKPDYKIIEGIIDGVKKEKLIIFDSTNKDFCYEYFRRRNIFQCVSCNRRNTYTTAQIYYYQTENEYIELNHSEHVCKIRLYNPTLKDDAIITKPDFEIQTILRNGKSVKRLIIFDSKNSNYCYEFSPGSHENTFICSKCNSKDAKIYATWYQDNESGKECVKTSSAKEHVCEPQIYVPESDKTEVTISITNFKIIPAMSKSTEKLIIFADDQQKLCYELSTSGSVYYCLGCTQQKKLRYSVKFQKNDETGEYFLTMKNHQKHACKPIKYNPEKYKEPKIIDESNYYFFFNKEKEARLLIFTAAEKTHCYQYKLKSDQYGFACIACLKSRKTITANLRRAPNGEEHIELGLSEHVCKPIKYSSIKSSIKEIVKYDAIIPPKQHGKTITEFELKDDENGNENKILITFASDDKALCYKYKFRNSDKKYLCINCNKYNVYARIYTSSKGDKYVVMGQNEHQCNPIKYDEIADDKKILNFAVFIRNDKKKAAKLIVFLDDEKRLCYEYSNQKGTPYFACTGCISKKKIQMKLLIDKDGQEYVLPVSKLEHYCSPIIFDPKKYENNPTMAQSRFELFPNIKGIPEKKMIIFDKNDYNLGYDYSFNENAFSCNKCLTEMKRISVKLCKNENGEYFLECRKTDHVCQIQNLFEEGRIIYPSNYKIEDNSITIQYPTNISKFYKFEYDDELQVFCCTECRERSKIVTGKICKKNNGNEFFLTSSDHFCTPLTE